MRGSPHRVLSLLDFSRVLLAKNDSGILFVYAHVTTRQQNRPDDQSSLDF